MSRVETTKENLKEVVALNNNFPFGMLLGGAVVIAAASVACANDDDLNNDQDCNEIGEAGTIAAAVILELITIIYVFLIFNGSISDGTEGFISVFLFLYWGALTFFSTFEGPFAADNANGLAGAWVGFAAAVGNLVYNVKFADSLKERFVNQGLHLCLLMVGSAVVIAGGLTVEDECCDGNQVLAIVTGGVSLVFVAFRILTGSKLQRAISIFLAAWWSILGILITFITFPDIDNGFIASWICVVASIGLVLGSSRAASPHFSARFSAKYQPQPSPQADAYQPQANAYADEDKGGDIEGMF